MVTIKAVFVYDDYWIDKTIQFFTDSKWSHIALWIPELQGYSGSIIIEAIDDGVVLQDGNKYNDRSPETVEFVDIVIEEDQFEIIKQKVLYCSNELYKYDNKALILNGLILKFNDDIKNKVSEILSCNTNHAMICSEIFTLIIREIFPNFLYGKLPCTISPKDIYDELKI